MNFRENFLLYILVPLLILCVGYSYYRFMVERDYMVAYEGSCDPASQSCFVGCDDDECTETYSYARMEKYAVDLYGQCGLDITDCDAANVCFAENDRNCSITYCDPATEEGGCFVAEEEAEDVPAPEASDL